MKSRVLPWQIALAIGVATSAAAMFPPVGQAQGTNAASKPANQQQAKQQKTPETLQTIVVTAEKRKQNLQDVPVAVTAITPAEINKLNITNVNDLAALSPGLMIEHNVSSDAPTIALRGTFNNDPSLFIDSPVAIYVDGVYYGKTAGAAFDLLDLDQIEVLRGPQGTLYGRNAFAGAISFTTHKPSGVFNGRAQVDIGNYGDTQGKFALDLPAMGKLKASVGGQIVNRAGWFNTEPGSSVSQMNNAHKRSGFVDLLLDATPTLSFEYRLDVHHRNQYPSFGQVIQSNTMEDFDIPIFAQSGRQTYGGVNSPVLDSMNMTGQAFTATWKPNDNNTFKYIYGHRGMADHQNLDLDGTLLDFGSANEFNRYLMTSSELQWIGNWNQFNWVAGLYRFNDTGFTSDPESFFFGQFNTDQRYGFATQSHAAYAQVNYDVTPQLTLTAGIRRTVDHQVGYEFNSGPGVDIPFFRGTTSAGGTTPMASISYKFTPEFMVYARYAEGFKGGGFNGQATSIEAAETPYGPEHKKSLEAGAKSMLWGGKLRLNGDVFYEKNSDLQETAAFAGASHTTGTNILNIGESHDEGVELEGEALISPNFSLSGNFAYLHEKFSKYMVLGENLADNEAVAGVPRYTFNLIANATLARTSKGVLSAVANFRYVAAFNPGVGEINAPDGDSVMLARTPAMGTWNGHLSFGGMNWGHGIDGEVRLWVQNIGNRDHIDGKIDFGPSFGGLVLGYYNMPRTYGVSVIASW